MMALVRENAIALCPLHFAAQLDSHIRQNSHQPLPTDRFGRAKDPDLHQAIPLALISGLGDRPRPKR